jgi:hypothetical protein
MSTKTAKKPAAKKPAVSIDYAQETLIGFTQVFYWILDDLPVTKLKQHLRALGIGIPKTKAQMTKRLIDAALALPVRATFSLSIF